MYRGDLRLTLLEIWFKKLWNHANNIFCKDTSSKNRSTVTGDMRKK